MGQVSRETLNLLCDVYANGEQCQFDGRATLVHAFARNLKTVPVLPLCQVYRRADNVAQRSSFWVLFHPQHRDSQRHRADRQKTDRQS
jgi:hypothetical protein